jgi:adenosyl cobinamide kinase/adenosyl cobinamide phosphate guanylyltransferase
MKIKCKRNIVIKGVAHVVGDIVEVTDNIGLDLVNTGRVDVYEDKIGITDRAVGLTKKSASSLVKRNTKKNAK